MDSQHERNGQDQGDADGHASEEPSREAGRAEGEAPHIADWVQARDQRRKKDSETRTALVEAASRVFAEHGYNTTSINDIAAAARVSRPSFYAYFASKPEVFLLVAQRLRDEFLAAHEHPDAITHDPATLIRASVREFHAAYAKNRQLLQIVDERAEMDEDIARIREEMTMRPYKRVIRHLNELTSAGAADPVVSAETIASLLRPLHFMFLDRQPRTPEEFEAQVDEVTAIYIRLIGLQRT